MPKNGLVVYKKYPHGWYISLLVSMSNYPQSRYISLV